MVLLGLKRQPDDIQAIKILAFLQPLRFSAIPHSFPTGQDVNWAIVLQLYSTGVDLTKQTSSKFWYTFFLG